MAATIQFTSFFFFFIFSSSFLPQSSSQFTPQNIQVFFPFPRHHHPPPPPPPPPDITPPNPTPNPIPNNPPSSSSKKTVAKAVGATAGAAFVLSGLLFLLFVKYKRHRKQKENPYAQDPPVNLMLNNRFTRVEAIKGVIVDEEGLDVLYWKNLDHDDDEQDDYGDKGKIFKKQHLRNDHYIQEAPLLKLKSSSSHLWPSGEEIKSQNHDLAVVNQEILMKSQKSSRSPPPTPSSPPPPSLPPLPLPPSQPKTSTLTSSSLSKQSLSPPLPQPQATSLTSSLKSKQPLSPPLPPPPPPLKTNSLTSSSKPPPPLRPPPMPLPPPQPKTTNGLTSSSKQPPSVQLKPLHWEKVNANVGHPTAWDKMDKGSFRFDGDLMEAMFGTVAANKKSQEENNSSAPKTKLKSGPPSQKFILETRKSQNVTIILRSLLVSRQEIIDCLLEGKGLDIDTLEKLTKIRPTKDEQQLILNYDQDITRLADAESFLYHILKAVPTAFTRFDTMFFRLNYTAEVSEVKNMLQTLEMACKELRTRGLFVKLLEAVLKAGNRMNAGTSRGNAQAFDLNSLLKLSDVKSSDGKTNLLHFVVEEVVRLEGKRCVINQKPGSITSDTSRDKDYIKLGLPVVGGVSSEFTNVKKAAAIEYDVILRSFSGLSDRLGEIMKSMEECGGGDGFVKGMDKFVGSAEREIRALREEQERVIGVVKKTNEYYRAGASKDKVKKQFQLFVIVKGFLEMVDKACVDIAVKLQKRRNGGGEEAETGVSNRPSLKFPVLPSNFISSSSSDSDEDGDL
ncbi:hypothetical protein QVD17_18338 [Tagetes erecta]|uniref:Formin-like protein n=1 Tax=Tagetes erecta TaxID=13708 RepID=A0AAD8KHK0_TARER|nr:hypothetical protein QVD17_18338 [Tagetes erecta]